MKIIFKTFNKYVNEIENFIPWHQVFQSRPVLPFSRFHPKDIQ